MNQEVVGEILLYTILSIPIVFVIGLIRQSLHEESVHPEDFSSSIEHSDHDKAA
ncbi:hypothetical protein [Halobacteriovorax sp. HLS]|uniref:hypothetical protein n=1 Tax=Halobacteriovorax sp. HLS TaxID=2234000 RepID=UPI0013E397B1|nr:hypothetical protein [Halobacteriovorax sp. HLS]